MNVVTGFGKTAGAAISSHMDIDKVTNQSLQCKQFVFVFFSENVVGINCRGALFSGQFHRLNRGWAFDHASSSRKQFEESDA